MDDLESLVYTMWYVAGFRMDPEKPEGSVLAELKEKGDAEAKSEMMVGKILTNQSNEFKLLIFIQMLTPLLEKV